ncbi:MAG: hypothetical protein ACRD0G_13355 [Acidimicrobiales bacterium]
MPTFCGSQVVDDKAARAAVTEVTAQMNDDDTYLQRIVVTVDLVGGPGTATIAATVFLNVLDHLEHEGLQPHWTTLEITGPTPTP